MRKKWTSSEDNALSSLVQECKSVPIDWGAISEKMYERGFQKSARQARERWTNQLNPDLERDSLDSNEHEKLLEMHNSLGNSWKKIAKNFPGRSDNGIKNQFFAMIRKGLRKARKSGRQSTNTPQVNEIKPKMLSKFLSLSVKVPPDMYSANPLFPWSLENPVKVSEFLRFFLFSKSSNFEPQITESVSNMINFILDRLEEQNREYVNSKSFKERKQRKILKKDIIASNRSEEKQKPRDLKHNTVKSVELERVNSIKRNPSSQNEIKMIEEMPFENDLLGPTLVRRDSSLPPPDEEFLKFPSLEKRLSGWADDLGIGDLPPLRSMSRKTSRIPLAEGDRGAQLISQEFPKRLELRPKESLMSNLSSQFMGGRKF